MMRARLWLVFLFLLPTLGGFRVFPGGNAWPINRADPTLWVRSCREITFRSANFPRHDPLAGTTAIPSYDTVLQSVLADYNNVPGSFIRLAPYPDDPANPGTPDSGDSAFTLEKAATRTIDVCFEDQTVTAGHARPEWADDGTVTGCSIKLNQNEIEKAEDFVSVFTHELGHCLGLDHPQETDDAIMSYFNKGTRLQIDDQMGLTQLYPQVDAYGRERATLGLSCAPVATAAERRSFAAMAAAARTATDSAAGPARGQADSEAPAGAGSAVYEKVREMVFKIKTAVDADSPKASYGTGFAVAENGLLLTNYHVVADAVLNPRQYRTFLTRADDSAVAARVLGVDVAHDLALLKVEQRFPRWLRFAPASRPPGQGDEIYSVGEPEDLNMAIVVGTYNNELRHGPYAVIHMSSPINSGMSGGPTLNGRGEIIGVNVAKNVSSDSLSFAVPARFAEDLLRKHAAREAPASETLVREIGEQLKSVQERLTSDWLATAQTAKPFGPWRLAQPSALLKCWSQKDDSEGEGKFETLSQSCQLPHSSYVDGDLQTGYHALSLDAIDGKQLGALRFYELLNSRFGGGYEPVSLFSFGEPGPAPLTRRFCFSDIVANKAGLKFKINVCSRGYARFSELLDTSVLAATLSPPPHALLLSLDLRGFTGANAKRILASTLESVSKEAP